MGEGNVIYPNVVIEIDKDSLSRSAIEISYFRARRFWLTKGRL